LTEIVKVTIHLNNKMYYTKIKLQEKTKINWNYREQIYHLIGAKSDFKVGRGAGNEN